MKKTYSAIVSLLLSLCLGTSAFAATEVGTVAALVSAAAAAGEYVLTDNISVDRLLINANITLDGNGFSLISANSTTNLKQATIAHKVDGLSSTFKNIVLDGANQAKTDTCLWLGRGSWVWESVTVQNWVSSNTNRGALTLGKSGSDAGVLTAKNCVIKDSSIGLTLDNNSASTSATFYSCTITDNTLDVKLPSVGGTLTFTDDADAAAKTIGTITMYGSTLNVGGNTSIAALTKSGGSLHITADITSESGISIIPTSLTDGSVIADVSETVDKSTVLGKVKLHDDVADNYFLALSGNNIILKAGVTVSGTYSDVSSLQYALVTLTDAQGNVIGAPVTATDEENVYAYSFASVAAGSYTLTIAKTACIPYTKEIEVAQLDVSVDSATLIYGDLDGSGAINASDLSVLLANYGKLYSEI